MSETMRENRILEVIEKLRGVGGEPYEGTTEKARRNPVKADTAPLLQAYAAMHKPQTILELGTAYGFSGLHFFLGHPKTKLVTLEFDPEVAEKAKMNFAEAGLSNYRVITGDSGEYLRRAPTMPDMVFFDHDKSRYLEDFQLIEPFLLGSTVLADNVIDRAEECGDFVEYVTARYETDIIQTQAGLLVARV